MRPESFFSTESDPSHIRKHVHDTLIKLLVFASAAIVFVPLFQRLGLGAILAYLFAGLIIGPHVLKLINDPETVLHISELGVVILLFTIGLDLDPKKLWQLRSNIFGMGMLQVVISGLLFCGLLIAFGINQAASLVIGFGLALSSTAFCIQILEEKKQLKTHHGQGTFSILMFQDLAVVPLLAMVSFLSGVQMQTLSMTDIARKIAILIVFIVVGRYAIRHALRLVANSKSYEIFIATALWIVVGSALLMDSIGLSMGMGAFLAGVLLANSEYRHELESSLNPFKGLLLGLFFMAVGMSLYLPVLVEKPHWIVLGTLAFMSLKSLIIFGLARLFKYPTASARNMAFMLPQSGEFAFVLFAAASSQQIFSPQTHGIVTAIVTLSMALTPFVFSWNQKHQKSHDAVNANKFDPIDNTQPTVIIAGYGRFGQIVSRFLRTQKVHHTILEHSAAQVETSRQFGYKIYYGDASRMDILMSAGIQTAKILVNTIDEPEKSLELVRKVKKYFPHIQIISRARDRRHAMNLMEQGVTIIHRETFLTSLEVSKEIMLLMGKTRPEINKQLAMFRKTDDSILAQQYELRHDEKKMINYTRQANLELEEILQQEQLESQEQSTAE